MSGRAAFLDRDGTINEKAPEGDYITTPEQFRFLDGAEQAVRMLDGDGWRVVVVTNQRGVALGRMTLDDVDRVNARHLVLEDDALPDREVLLDVLQFDQVARRSAVGRRRAHAASVPCTPPASAVRPIWPSPASRRLRFSSTGSQQRSLCSGA